MSHLQKFNGKNIFLLHEVNMMQYKKEFYFKVSYDSSTNKRNKLSAFYSICGFFITKLLSQSTTFQAILKLSMLYLGRFSGKFASTPNVVAIKKACNILNAVHNKAERTN